MVGKIFSGYEQHGRITLGDYKRLFAGQIKGIQNVMRGMREGGFYIHIYLGKRSGSEFIHKTDAISRSLHYNSIDPKLAHDIFSLFSVTNLLEMHHAGQKLNEIHVYKIFDIQNPAVSGYKDHTVEWPKLSREEKINKLSKLGVINLTVLTAEQMDQREKDRLAQVESKRAADELDAKIKKMKPFGMWQPKD